MGQANLYVFAMQRIRFFRGLAYRGFAFSLKTCDVRLSFIRTRSSSGARSVLKKRRTCPLVSLSSCIDIVRSGVCFEGSSRCYLHASFMTGKHEVRADEGPIEKVEVLVELDKGISIAAVGLI